MQYNVQCIAQNFLFTEQWTVNTEYTVQYGAQSSNSAAKYTVMYNFGSNCLGYWREQCTVQCNVKLYYIQCNNGRSSVVILQYSTVHAAYGTTA